MTVQGWLCGPRLYEYDGWFFEQSTYGGPWPLRKDGGLRKCAGRVFWEMHERWTNEKDPESFRVGGGCKLFNY